VSKENSLRHFLNILFSEGDNELDGSEDPESVVGPAELLLLIGVTGVKSARRPNRVNLGVNSPTTTSSPLSNHFMFPPRP
jgi:hypothetical protein